ncbi:MAG: NUDIX domain-containing protein [Firmicutes bacterium]|nr:NUDIX domain-containing protein [Bacillota bacterium]
MKNIRVSAKAVIIQDGRLLVTKNVDQFGTFYLLPGGGQLPGETLIDALKRECREEIGVEVDVGELLFVREYIGCNHEFAFWDGDIHQVELMFACTVRDGQVPQKGVEPDRYQVSVEWLDLDGLDSRRLYPQALKRYVASSRREERCIYMGDVN